MAGKADQMKGKAKEAVGDLTGNKDLKSEGKPIVRPARPKRRSAKLRRRSKT
jgi:hypothetical protein